MSGTTPRMGLKTFDSTDPFLRSDFNDNSARLDAYPGQYICTSGTRPAWGPNQAGLRIYETDTRREVVWTGTAWRELLSATTAWSGAISPNVTMGHNTHVYYNLATFQVNRPGSLLVLLHSEFVCKSLYTMNAHFRPQVDGVDSSVGGGSAGYMRLTQIQTSGTGWDRAYMAPAMGIKAVGVGSHKFGIHMFTTPTTVTSAGSLRLVNVRGVAMLVNSSDT
ncbi:hypothetical protein [Streptomyces sp. NPDC088752]|uniref:hypothetical protein n=1 Tax=Streptomyces sp. NPDC088752 TaxID=3154963 RepID=UPI003445148C